MRNNALPSPNPEADGITFRRGRFIDNNGYPEEFVGNGKNRTGYPEGWIVANGGEGWR